MALDEKGIYLDEVKNKFPRSFQTLNYDVALDTDDMYKPRVKSSFELCVDSILTLLYMKPGQYPSIPELGIDIESYLHEYAGDPKIPAEIKNKLYKQCNRIEMAGITVDVYFDKTSEGMDALVIDIKGNEYLSYGQKSEHILIGITYDKLNRIYTKKVFV